MSDRERYGLVNVEARARRSPSSFRIPLRQQRWTLRVGVLVKLIFTTATRAERMWVVVEHQSSSGRYRGRLNSDPVFIELRPGALITFGPEHVAEIDSESLN